MHVLFSLPIQKSSTDNLKPPFSTSDWEGNFKDCNDYSWIVWPDWWETNMILSKLKTQSFTKWYSGCLIFWVSSVYILSFTWFNCYYYFFVFLKLFFNEGSFLNCCCWNKEITQTKLSFLILITLFLPFSFPLKFSIVILKSIFNSVKSSRYFEAFYWESNGKYN